MLMILIMMAALCLGMDAAVYKAFKERVDEVREQVAGAFRRGKRQIDPRPLPVLLVSSHERDYVRVVGTLSPRGVPVVRAPDEPSGLQMVSDRRFCPGMLVVDGELPDRKRLVQQWQQRFPELTVLVLDRVRDPAAIAAALMTYAERANR
jgi:hypothetical protein